MNFFFLNLKKLWHLSKCTKVSEKIALGSDKAQYAGKSQIIKCVKWFKTGQHKQLILTKEQQLWVCYYLSLLGIMTRSNKNKKNNADIRYKTIWRTLWLQVIASLKLFVCCNLMLMDFSLINMTFNRENKQDLHKFATAMKRLLLQFQVITLQIKSNLASKWV